MIKLFLIFLINLLFLYENIYFVSSLECYVDVNSNINYNNGECGCVTTTNPNTPPCKSFLETGIKIREFIRINKADNNNYSFLKLFEKLTIIISDGIYYVNNNNLLGDIDTFNEIVIQNYHSFKFNSSDSPSQVFIDGGNSSPNQYFLSSNINKLVGLSYPNIFLINSINFINWKSNNINPVNWNNQYILNFQSTNKEFNKVLIVNSSFNNIKNIGIVSVVNKITTKIPLDRGNSPMFQCDFCNFTNINYNNNNKSPLQFNNLKVIFTYSFFNNNTISSKSFINNEIGVINGTNFSYYLTHFFSSVFYNNTIINNNQYNNYNNSFSQNIDTVNSFISVKNSLLYFNFNIVNNNTGSIITFDGNQDQIDTLQQGNNIYFLFDNNLFSSNKIINYNNNNYEYSLINLHKSHYDYINYRSLFSNSIFQNNQIFNNNNYLVISKSFSIEFANITIENPLLFPPTLQNNYKFIFSKNSFIIITNSYILSNSLVCGNLSNIHIKGSKISLDFSNLYRCLNCHYNIEILDTLNGEALRSYEFTTSYDTTDPHTNNPAKPNIDHYKLYLKIIISIILLIITTALIYLCFFLNIPNN
ncbi:hypothetical protein DICPUDRAFT_156675 [Dictyostelium purpureum]|uniref:Uncharacterized protein n=1 Tax=Dictyostelium purpureum TaxID=5786 RepID=F0ZX47_DICPU|nr:uncharacterized protein DICPUDRAFT_156675 [Dictyostelium purpureum]EGC31490.1 hypothetical protein DICPUDRAFT_156675 [Dictyostelium purpureum]|eukprot:XP_003291995.1 hypothetical protein DICPUDRAFT_156675 [Dictyostelium purpureum]